MRISAKKRRCSMKLMKRAAALFLAKKILQDIACNI